MLTSGFQKLTYKSNVRRGCVGPSWVTATTSIKEALVEEMRIAMIAPLEMRVPPIAYGGSELVVSLLTEELVSRGHDVTLFANVRFTPESGHYGGRVVKVR